MNAMLAPVKTSIGKKAIMGVTGVLLVLFVLGHMTGNLLIFAGRDAINEYARFLHEAGHGALIWVARLGLLAVFVTHMSLAFILRSENRMARPVRYVVEDTVQASWASRNMMLTGIVMLLFLIYHIAHFTLGATDPATFKGAFEPRGEQKLEDVYQMVVKGFQQPVVAGLYLLAQLALCVHLWHGAGSWMQSLGLNRGKLRQTSRLVGPVIALAVLAGNTLIVLACLLGIVSV
jgi:succinate dehydrogenase / fumarate reductase cytochrome b subunit